MEQEKSTDGEEPGAHDRHDPMDAWTCGPAEPEEADWYAKGADESRRESFLRFNLAVIVKSRFDYFIQIVEEWRDDEDSAEENSYECKTFLAKVEVVDAFEDDGEGFEPDV